MISVRPSFVFASLIVLAASVRPPAPALAGPAAPEAAAPALLAAHEAAREGPHDAPIVSGRSVASRRGSKLHHVRMKAEPFVAAAPGLEEPSVADGVDPDAGAK